MTLRSFYRPTLGLALTLLAGCSSNPITGRSQAALVSDEAAARQSVKAYAQLLDEARTEQVLDPDAGQTERVRTVARPLIAQAEALRPKTRTWSWEVHVIQSKTVNAWCMAGGKMAVYSGLLSQLKPTDDELAAVMGHEIAHALLSHQAEKMSRNAMQEVGVQAGVLAGALFGINLSGLAPVAHSIADLGVQLPNSREAESEADTVGLTLAAKAGFDPEAAVTLWQKMLKIEGPKAPEWLSTHPDTESRIKTLEAAAIRLKPVYEAARKSRVPATATPL